MVKISDKIKDGHANVRGERRNRRLTIALSVGIPFAIAVVLYGIF
jgi:hypothetical protein